MNQVRAAFLETLRAVFSDRYAVVTLAGRTTAPAMASFRQILQAHLSDAPATVTGA